MNATITIPADPLLDRMFRSTLKANGATVNSAVTVGPAANRNRVTVYFLEGIDTDKAQRIADAVLVAADIRDDPDGGPIPSRPGRNRKQEEGIMKYEATVIHEDRTRTVYRDIDVPADTPVRDIVGGRLDTAGGDWVLLRRLSTPGGVWVWEVWERPPDGGGYEARTREQLRSWMGDVPYLPDEIERARPIPIDTARREAAVRNAAQFGTDPSWYGQ